MSSYQESCHLLYSMNVFTFRDPYAVMFWSIRLPEAHLQRVQRMYLHLGLYYSPAYFEVEQRKMWTQLWSAIEKFNGLRELDVSMVTGRPEHVGHYTQDTAWLEPLKRVSAPEIFKLLIPADTRSVDVDMQPSNCEILGHPWFSFPESIRNPDFRREWLATHG